MLKRITVRGFKSIRALEDFELRNLNVLIGANGAGKSNFIGLFHMLAALAGQRLQRFVAEQDGPDALLFGGRKRTRSLHAEFVFGSDGYEFSLAPAGNRLLFADEATTCRQDGVRTRRTLGNGHGEAHLPDVADNAFAGYVRSTMRSWRVHHFHDTGATAPLRHAQAVRDNLVLKTDAGNLGPFLRRLHEQEPDRHRQIVETVRLAAPFFGGFVHRRNPGEREEIEWFPADDPDTVLGPRQISDGTLRFICLATLLLQPAHLRPDRILIAEPELGLHPFAICLLAEMLRQASDERQVLVSTQSVELINELEPEDVVVVDRKEGESVFRRLERGPLRDWPGHEGRRVVYSNRSCFRTSRSSARRSRTG